mgnify:CR=1 FL=1
MVINDFNVVSIAIFKTETYAPLVINSDTPLPSTVVNQRFQFVGRREAQILDAHSPV